MSSTAIIVINLFFGFLFIGASALVGTPLLYYLVETMEDMNLINDPTIQAKVNANNEEVLLFFEAFPFVIGVALVLRGVLMMRARGQEIA